MLVHCHAGCPLDDVLSAFALDRRDLFHEPRERAEDRPMAPRTPPAKPPTDADVARWRDRLQGHPTALAALAKRRCWPADVLAALDVGIDDLGRLVFAVKDADGHWLAVESRSPDSSGQTKAATGVERQLWPRPEDVPGDVLWIGEGHVDAVTLTALGLHAVSGAVSVDLARGLDAARHRRTRSRGHRHGLRQGGPRRRRQDQPCRRAALP